MFTGRFFVIVGGLPGRIDGIEVKGDDAIVLGDIDGLDPGPVKPLAQQHRPAGGPFRALRGLIDQVDSGALGGEADEEMVGLARRAELEDLVAIDGVKDLLDPRGHQKGPKFWSEEVKISKRKVHRQSQEIVGISKDRDSLAKAENSRTIRFRGRVAMRKWTGQALRRALWIGGLVALVGFGVGCAQFGNQSAEEELQKQAEWHYEMGQGYFESNETTHAIRELVQAVEINPEYAEAHYLLGFIYMGRRDYTRSVHHFRRTLAIDPGYHFAKNNLGTVYLAMERWEDAAVLFQELLDEILYTTPELAHNNLGWAYFQMGRNAEALEHLRMAVFLSPDMCLAENNMGQVYEQMSNQSDAIRHYRRAIEKCPRNYQEPHYRLGRLLQEQGNQNAGAHFQRCIEIQPNTDMAERCRQFLSVN